MFRGDSTDFWDNDKVIRKVIRKRHTLVGFLAKKDERGWLSPECHLPARCHSELPVVQRGGCGGGKVMLSRSCQWNTCTVLWERGRNRVNSTEGRWTALAAHSLPGHFLCQSQPHQNLLCFISLIAGIIWLPAHLFFLSHAINVPVLQPGEYCPSCCCPSAREGPFICRRMIDEHRNPFSLGFKVRRQV